MTVSIPKLLRHYTNVLFVGGSIVTATVLVWDRHWIEQPISTLLLMVSIFALRSVPVRLSKYSYLTQSGIPTLVGAVCVGPAPVVAALWVGVVSADVFGLRKQGRAGLVNAGREVIGFMAAFGFYAAILALDGTTELTVDFLPAAAILVSLYFFVSRALFYFSLLIRDKLESAERSSSCAGKSARTFSPSSAPRSWSPRWRRWPLWDGWRSPLRWESWACSPSRFSMKRSGPKI